MPGKSGIGAPEGRQSFGVVPYPAGAGISSVSLFALLIVAFLENHLQAAPGDLDPTFGSNGVVISSFGSNDSALATSMVLQPDGKIVVGGFAKADFVLETPVVVRYNIDGTPDTSFGDGGCVSTLELTKTNLVRKYTSTAKTGVALQPDGKIVLGATGWPRPTGLPYVQVYGIFRFGDDGTPDASFDADGYRLMSLGSITSMPFGGLVLQPDGKIVFTGYSNGMNVVRLQPNGSSDLGFGVGGVALAVPDLVSNSYITVSSAAATILAPDGTVLVAGTAYHDTNWCAVVARLTPFGSLVTSFGSDGKAIALLGADSSAAAVARQADGKIVVGGRFANGAISAILLLRYDYYGNPDTTFGSNGVVICDVGAANEGTSAIALQADGKVVVSGSIWNDAQYDSVLLRFNTDGSLDSGFGSNGVVVTEFSPANDYTTAVAIQPDGKIVTAGYAALNPSNQFVLARYDSGLGPAPEIDVVAASSLTHTLSRINLGSIASGASNTVVLTVRNVGYTNLTGLAVTIDGTNAADFAVEQPTDTDLAPGSNTTFTVSFTAGAIGQSTAALHIASSDLDENPFDITLVARSLTRIEAWRLAHFGSPDDIGDGADSNDWESDGNANLIEFATDSDPRQYGPFPATLAGDGASLLFTFTRNKAAVGELSFIVEWSDTLLPDDWHTDGTSESILSDDGQTQRVQITLPISPGPARFVRLRVTRP